MGKPSELFGIKLLFVKGVRTPNKDGGTYSLILWNRQTVTNKRLWTVSCQCLPAGAGREGIAAYHVDGEKVLTVQEIEQRLADLEQARYRIAALEAAMLEAGLEFGYPWEDNVCPDCGDTGIGLLGIHQWLEHVQVGYEEYEPVHQVQEEYGTPCPTCGRVADNDDLT